jgi:hypothetical protein
MVKKRFFYISNFSLPPNPILDTLIIRLDCLLRDNVMDNSNESIRKRLPKYEKAIECVKAINPNIKLKLFAARSFSDETLDLDVKFISIIHIKFGFRTHI